MLTKTGIPLGPTDTIDANCLNAHQMGLSLGQSIPRGPKRYSLTFRFIEYVDATAEEFELPSHMDTDADGPDESEAAVHYFQANEEYLSF